MLTSFLLMQYFGVFLSNLIGPLKFQEGEYLPKPCMCSLTSYADPF